MTGEQLLWGQRAAAEVVYCVCACVCVYRERERESRTFASNCSILWSVFQNVVCMPTACRVVSRFFEQSIWTIDVAISCAALQTNPTPDSAGLLSMPDQVQNVKFLRAHTPPHTSSSILCVRVCVFTLARLCNNSLMYVNFVAYLYQCHVLCL